MAINSGELRHPITIQAPANAVQSGSFGASVTPSSWTVVRSDMASIYTAGGRETSQASQLVSEVSHVVKIRWTSDVLKAGYQIVFGARIFTVLYIENVQERNLVLLLYCKEVDGAQ
ncbi:MAG TPA: head-tail adaptor protein [Alloacidobacterium sp.]|nr:head-tail adaptor protein [Alloacidobacterium sp.]